MPVIELDMLLALVNRADKLHPVAARLFELIVAGEIKNVAIPVSAYIEYELVLRARGYSEESIRSDIDAFRRLSNIDEIPLTASILVEASKLRELYELTYFDSMHAASALAFDKSIISVDQAYRRVPQPKVINPAELVQRYGDFEGPIIDDIELQRRRPMTNPAHILTTSMLDPYLAKKLRDHRDN